MKTDVLVIGGGLAGSLAALQAARSGRRVTLVSSGEATLHMESGCIDLWGEAHAPGQAIAALREKKPGHPYALAGAGALAEGLELFLRLTQEAGYPYQGGLDRSWLVPTAIGGLKPTGLVPPTMAAGDAGEIGSLLVVGIEEFKDSYPALAAENLAALLGIPVRSATVSMAYAGFSELSPVQAAHLLDDSEVRRSFLTRLASVHRGEAVVGLPPVLGLRQAPAVLADCRRALKAEVFEMPALSPSVPGMRLAQILADALRQAGVRLVKAEAVEGLTEGSRATGARLRSLGGASEVEAQAVVLATGGLAGGALELNDRRGLQERVFHLPVQLPANPDDWTHPEWLSPEGQPLSQAGVSADSRLRPLGRDGQVLFDNLFLAGRLLAGHDPIAEKSGNGVAIASGYRAGKLAAEVLAS